MYFAPIVIMHQTSIAQDCNDYGTINKIVGTVNTDRASGVYVVGDFAYVADGPSGLQVIDVCLPNNPSIVGNVETDRAFNIFVTNDLAYIVDGPSVCRLLTLVYLPLQQSLAALSPQVLPMGFL